jgi:hypothetical protein
MNDIQSPWSTEVLQGRRILVVEDSEPERAAAYLQEGCRVLWRRMDWTARKAALLKLDLILMDIQHAGMRWPGLPATGSEPRTQASRISTRANRRTVCKLIAGQSTM